MRGLAGLTAAIVIGTSSLALANPVMVVDEGDVEQLPGSSHVLVTRRCSDGARTLTRDGTVIGIVVETKVIGSRDLGSGTQSIYERTICDCNVPVGHHVYAFGSQLNAQIDVTAVDASQAQSSRCDLPCADAGGGGANTGDVARKVPVDAAVAPRVDAAGTAPVDAAGTAPVDAAGTAPVDAAGTGAAGSAVPPPTGGSGGNSAGSENDKASGEAGHSSSPATGGTVAPASGTSSRAGGAGVSEKPSGGGCALSHAERGLSPFGILAAFVFLARRRR